MPEKACIYGDWDDQAFPYEHAVYAVIAEGRSFSSLYDFRLTSIAHFQDTYHFAFRPWPIDGALTTGNELYVPPQIVDSPEKGKRELKPGPKPKHKRKKG
uniref:Uncharacterized protein n=1 Tax=Globisporangium ultimum (strain ATCC 200006 / CBS 805.95 / DAOM BR144) TaxID=431595 RepID=K3WWH1_GLOUD